MRTCNPNYVSQNSKINIVDCIIFLKHIESLRLVQIFCVKRITTSQKTEYFY